MYIYKITNKINNKVYIGQVYNKTIMDRFNRHIKDASSKSRSYIDRSIYKYGRDNFVCELIDTATSLQELNEKEKYWIKYYNSTDRNIGYNLTPGGDGGNTYLCKTKKEMLEIKNKISIANGGSNNGMSKQIKALNINTHEIIHFDTLHEACKYFNHKQKGSFLIHCDHKAKNLWRKEWTFAYESDEFYYEHLNIEYDKSCNKGTLVKLLNLETNEEIIFNSLNKLNSYLGLPKGKLKYDNGICFYKNYKITKVKVK
jgi:group I intron endonuclease